MTAKILILILFLFGFNIYAQKINSPNAVNSNNQPNQINDDLLKHLSAAETYQISGDLANAAIENRAILGIALQRAGNIAIEEGNYQEAVDLLTSSLIYEDNAPNRLNLAAAYLRQNKLDNAIAEAQKAFSLDPNFLGASYILGNIYFTKDDYQAALPHLEKVFQTTPNFEIAEALGLTYLHLKQLERAKLLFEEVRIAKGKEMAQLHLSFSQATKKQIIR